MISRRVLACAVFLVAVVVPACTDDPDGGDEVATPTTAPDTGPTSTTTSAAPSSTTTSSTTTSSPPTTAQPSAATSTTEPDLLEGLVQFQLPSGNIGCSMTVHSARCDIGQAEWAPPPAPADCQLDYGHGLVVEDEAGFVCAGDTVLGAGDTLAYGSSMQRGPFVCESAQTGVSCRNTATGAGFDLSRRAYQLF